jgi:phosphoribosylformylglycinamidine synthase II
MLWEVEVRAVDAAADRAARDLVAAAAALGLPGVTAARTAASWLIEADLPRGEIERIAATLLADPVTDHCTVAAVGGETAGPPGLPTAVRVLPRPGVTDPAGQSAQAAIGLLGMEVTAVRSVRLLHLPALSAADAERLAWRTIASDAIHDVVVGPLTLTSLAGGRTWQFTQSVVRLEGRTDHELERLSRERCLALSVVELTAIRDHFRTLGRDPLEIELETIAQTWSEHCCHKTLTAGYDHTGPDGPRRYDNLLKETVFAATRQVREALGPADWCVSVFRDNSGVVRFDGDHDICVKVETHNHPSAIEPYGGAATGLGGVIRDVLGTGLGARPIANLDVFCVGPPDTATADLPAGVIPPRRLLAGVVAGVRDYGNRMGIPTIAGGVAFDPGYVGNPLVFCGTVGIMPRGTATLATVAPGDLVVVAGGRTGRDGIHGATFSSIELSSASESQSGGAVQIGHAINEKILTDFVLEAAAQRLFRAITDCGAGGLSSAVGEMGAALGAEVDLDRVPLKYPGLSATEAWISEAQERMVLAVPPECWDRLAAIAADEGVEATAIGRFTGTGRIVLRWEQRVAGDLDCHFLHEGRPRPRLVSRAVRPVAAAATWADTAITGGVGSCLLTLLAAADVASKEWIIRQYDHEVQGGSVVKPLLGPGAGPADGTVIRGVLGRDRGIVLGVGLRHRLGEIDAHAMAAGGIIEAVANIVAVGADPTRVALLDNFCWGDCRRSESLGALVEACHACHDVAVALGAPFVSGKDSLNNVFAWTGADGSRRERSIPHTLLATALGQVDDVKRVVTPDLKRAGSRLAIVGLSRDDLAGSQITAAGLATGGAIPAVDAARCRRVFTAMAAAIRDGLVAACHDCSDGGLAVAVAEMMIGGGLGAIVRLADVPYAGRDDHGPATDLAIGFAESPCRFVVEVTDADADAFAARFAGLEWAWIGSVVAEPALTMLPIGGGLPTIIGLDRIDRAWRTTVSD